MVFGFPGFMDVPYLLAGFLPCETSLLGGEAARTTPREALKHFGLCR